MGKFIHASEQGGGGMGIPDQTGSHQRPRFFDLPITVHATTSPTQLGFPRKLTRILKDFVLGRKPMKRMLLPQYCIFSHVFHFFDPNKIKNYTL
jgi:hypothetical protein